MNGLAPGVTRASGGVVVPGQHEGTARSAHKNLTKDAFGDYVKR